MRYNIPCCLRYHPLLQYTIRKTKILCTAGPACWSEEMLGKLLDAGMNILRFNFSQGDHKGHLEVLERFRKVRVTTGHGASNTLWSRRFEGRLALQQLSDGRWLRICHDVRAAVAPSEAQP